MESLIFLDSLSASTFLLPGMWEALIQIFLRKHYSQIWTAMSLQLRDLIPLMALR